MPSNILCKSPLRHCDAHYVVNLTDLFFLFTSYMQVYRFLFIPLIDLFHTIRNPIATNRMTIAYFGLNT